MIELAFFAAFLVAFYYFVTRTAEDQSIRNIEAFKD